MNYLLPFRFLLLFACFSSTVVNAGNYLELSAGPILINTNTSSTQPWVADFRLGHAIQSHQLELALMSSFQHDDLNQLTVSVPSVFSVFYHYLPFTQPSIKLHLILGFSQVEVESAYPVVANSSDSFSGASYGIGFEESFKSMPQLKISVDWIRLYDGEKIDIDVTSFGVHYEF